MPEVQELRRLPRQWVINVVNTIVGVPFQQWVHSLIECRNAKIVADRKLEIEMDPAILAAFQSSTFQTSKLPICQSILLIVLLTVVLM